MLSLVAVKAKANDSNSLYVLTTSVYKMENKFKGSAINVLTKKDDSLDQALAEIASDEWQKELKKKFTEKEINYLNQLFSNQLLKRFHEFNENFNNYKSIGDILSQKIKDKEIQIIVNRKDKPKENK